MFYHFIVSMKKYFLLIALLAFVCLWLGSYSYASTSCSATASTHASEQRTGHAFTCETSSPTNASACTDNVGNAQSCYAPSPSAGDTCTLNCCVCTNNNPAPTTTTPPSSTAWTSCPDVAWIPQKWVNTGNGTGMCKSCKDPWVCCGVSLNTSIPFIGKCIENSAASVGPDETGVTWVDAFPVLMWSLTKILVTLILIVSFVLIIIGGIMIASGDPSKGKKMITNVIIGIALLGASGVILRLINPNFFG